MHLALLRGTRACQWTKCGAFSEDAACSSQHSRSTGISHHDTLVGTAAFMSTHDRSRQIAAPRQRAPAWNALYRRHFLGRTSTPAAPLPASAPRTPAAHARMVAHRPRRWQAVASCATACWAQPVRSSVRAAHKLRPRRRHGLPAHSAPEAGGQRPPRALPTASASRLQINSCSH